MHDRGAAFMNRSLQPLSRLLLVSAPNREDHSPMATQKIGFPGRAALGLEQRFPCLAEGTQALVAGNDHLVRPGAYPARVAGDDGANQPATGLGLRRRQARLETGLVEELPHRPRSEEHT